MINYKFTDFQKMLRENEKEKDPNFKLTQETALSYVEVKKPIGFENIPSKYRFIDEYNEVLHKMKLMILVDTTPIYYKALSQKERHRQLFSTIGKGHLI
jgi:hypothetical protein